MENKRPTTPEEAIWDIYSRVMSLETTLLGHANSQDGGLVAEVQEIKALAIEVKDSHNRTSQGVTWLQTRCRLFHGEGNNQEENPLRRVSKTRLVTFVVTAGTFVAVAVYNLGGLFGWWEVK